MVQSEAMFDVFGGWKEIRGEKTGFFHTEYIDGRWWIITPDGNGFFCKGIGGVGWWQEPPAENDPNPWTKSTSRLLQDLHFNAIGLPNPIMYNQGLAFAPLLDLAGSQANVFETGEVLDYFSEEFREGVERAAAAEVPKYVDNPWLLGYFTDNELHWSLDWRSKDTVLEAYLKLPESSPGFRKAMAFLEERGLKPEYGIPDTDKDEFLQIAADRYASICHDAIRRHDKNHMIMGCRFYGYLWGWCESGFDPEGLLRAVAPYFDIISCNNYSPVVPMELFNKITEFTAKPLMITEFSFRSVDSGHPNTRGAGMIVRTQQERAERFRMYSQALASLPGCVGFHWFMFRDQAKDSTWENSNYGIVKEDYTLWETMAATMKEVNGSLELKHLATGK